MYRTPHGWSRGPWWSKRVCFCNAMRVVGQPGMFKNLFTLLDLCVSSMCRGHANLLCISCFSVSFVLCVMCFVFVLCFVLWFDFLHLLCAFVFLWFCSCFVFVVMFISLSFVLYCYVTWFDIMFCALAVCIWFCISVVLHSNSFFLFLYIVWKLTCTEETHPPICWVPPLDARCLS